MRVFVASLLLATCCFAETKTMSLRQAMDLAIQQNPDVILARLDQERARQQAIIASDPFSPKVVAGSGLAYTDGFPTSIDGNAPSIVQAKTIWSLYNKPTSYQVQAAKENVRAAGFDLEYRQQEVAYQVAGFFLDAQHASQNLAAAQRQLETLNRVRQLIADRYEAGRELKIELSKADNSVAHAKRAVSALTADVNRAEMSLAIALGMTPTDRVQPSEGASQFQPPLSEDDAVAKALAGSSEVRKLQSNLLAKQIEIKQYQAYRRPQIDAVAQYSALAPYNNFKQYFQRFQINNAELGLSFQIPLLTGRAPKAYISKAETEAMAIQADMRRTRGRIEADIRKAFAEILNADDGRDLARSDLDLAREQVSLDLDQATEGRVPQSKLEQDRADEDSKWIAYYDAQVVSERARLSVLRVTGTLLEAVK
jgi:outer membrane protein TolC